MAFSSVQFLFVFLPLALAAYYPLPALVGAAARGACRLLPRSARAAAQPVCSRLPQWARTGVLAAFSLLFFLWSGRRAALLLAGTAALHWAAGLVLVRLARRGPLLALAAAADLAVLGVFKYAGFVSANVNAVLPGLLPELQPVLPLGLSFYLFIALGYLADVAAGRCEAMRSPVRFFVFLAFFGHSPSGPIVRAAQQAPQLASPAPFEAERFCAGIKRFILGLSKKVLLADQLALVYNRAVSVPSAMLPAPLLALGYTAFMMQLYFDFSGYSDMAVGLGWLFGLDLPENFDYPYLSCSVGEYWRRWHMTLSGWFRDYVYIPLGGSRCGLGRTCLNLIVVFLLTGLWHGAAWNYLAFGLYHGLLLCAERLFLRAVLDRLPRLLCRLYTLAALWLGIFLFGAHGLREALAALYGVLTWQPGSPGLTLAALADTKLLLILAAALLLCGPVQAVLPRLRERLRARTAPGVPGMAGLFVLLFFCIMRLTAANYNAFIYAQF